MGQKFSPRPSFPQRKQKKSVICTENRHRKSGGETKQDASFAPTESGHPQKPVFVSTAANQNQEQWNSSPEIFQENSQFAWPNGHSRTQKEGRELEPKNQHNTARLEEGPPSSPIDETPVSGC
ncbi:hypothetical protein V6Z11_D07G144800 [Gossypium hirsutum]